MRKTAAILLTISLLLCCTACAGFDISAVTGEWKLTHIDGYTVANYAELVGAELSQTEMSVTVTESSYISRTAAGTEEYPIRIVSDGFEVLSNGEALITVRRNIEEDNLYYSVDLGGDTVELILQRTG